MKYARDPTATAAAITVTKARAVRERIAGELEAARGALAALVRPEPFDAAAAALERARAETADAVHGTATAAALAEQHKHEADAYAQSAAEYEARVSELRRAVEDRQIALLGADHVLKEAVADSKAATAAAARGALREARERYRKAIVVALDAVTDVLGLETLSMLDTWSDNRALDVRRFAVELPALGAFDAKGRDLSAIGAHYVPGPADVVRLTGDGVRVQALEDLRAIRAELEGRA